MIEVTKWFERPGVLEQLELQHHFGAEGRPLLDGAASPAPAGGGADSIAEIAACPPNCFESGRSGLHGKPREFMAGIVA